MGYTSVVQHYSNSGSGAPLTQNIFRLSVATARGDLHTAGTNGTIHYTIPVFIQTDNQILRRPVPK